MNAITMKAIRLFHGLKPEEMAQKLGVSRSSIYRIESGSMGVSAAMKYRLGQAFDLTNPALLDAIEQTKKANEILGGI